MKRVSIPLDVAVDLLQQLDAWNEDKELSSAARTLGAAVDFARRVRPGLKSAAKVRGQKKRAKKSETSDIRAAVMKRAGLRCECCGGGGSIHNPLTLDHFFGRVRAKQAASNCWALCLSCHHQKTDNRPSPETWLQAFITHAEKHGYHSEFRMAATRLRSLDLQAEAVHE